MRQRRQPLRLGVRGLHASGSGHEEIQLDRVHFPVFAPEIPRTSVINFTAPDSGTFDFHPHATGQLEHQSAALRTTASAPATAPNHWTGAPVASKWKWFPCGSRVRCLPAGQTAFVCQEDGMADGRQFHQNVSTSTPSTSSSASTSLGSKSLPSVSSRDLHLRSSYRFTTWEHPARE